eukprot:15354350-Ditylum_brightwellii.AAC.1
MEEGLEEEIKLRLEEKNKEWVVLHELNPEVAGVEPLTYNKWKELSAEDSRKCVPIIICFDMGLQQRGFCSLSDHALMIVVQSRKVLDCIVCAEECQKCKSAKKRKKKAKKHQYPKNYEGSSKGMEAHSALLLN